MAPHFRVRRVTLRDLDTLVAHRRAMFEAFGDHTVRSLDAADPVYRRWARARLKSGKLVAWVATAADGRPVASGCLWLQPVQPNPARAANEVPYLLSMFTEKAARGNGLATRIVKEAMRWSKERGHPRMRLHASKFGAPVYRRLGWTKTREMKYDFGGKARAAGRSRRKR
ncbi:MAG: GNAT family N-acetyltransferase [Thermoplasmatota archaeon]